MKALKSQSLDVALKVAEAHQERELESKITARMRQSMRDNGDRDSTRAVILTNVAAENYAAALEEIRRYAESKNDFPQFRLRTERYLSYAVDLVNAIRAKRSFPGMQNLSMSKQQDLYDRAMSHFEDLKVTLKKVDLIEKEVKLDDVRSTVWVIKAIIYSVFAIFVLGFLLEVSRGVLPAAGIVVDDLFGSLTNALFDKIGL